jgi:hypothetical protein
MLARFEKEKRPRDGNPWASGDMLRELEIVMRHGKHWFWKGILA